jgi:WD40 repeat protein
VVIVDTGTGQQWASTPMPCTVTDLAWINARRTLALAAYGGVTLLEATPGGNSAVKPFVGSLLALATTRDGRWIVSGNQDASLQVFSAARDTRLEMQGYLTKITRVAFDASEEHLANDGAPEVTVWDFRGRGPEGTAPTLVTESDGPGTADVFTWHPRSSFLATAWQSGRVEVADVRRGRPGKPLPGTPIGSVDDRVADLAWTTDGRGLIIASRDGRVERIPAAVR